MELAARLTRASRLSAALPKAENYMFIASAYAGVSCRCASTAAQAGQRTPPKTVKATMTRSDRMRPKPGDPYFREIWRKFQLKVHPDLFSQFPELQAVNAESLQRLQGLLNEVKSLERPEEDRVRPRTEKLQFFVRASSSAAGDKPHFLKVPVNIQLNGQHAHNTLALCFASLFRACGLPDRFHWGNDYFASTFVPTPPQQQQPE